MEFSERSRSVNAFPRRYQRLIRDGFFLRRCSETTNCRDVYDHRHVEVGGGGWRDHLPSSSSLLSFFERYDIPYALRARRAKAEAGGEEKYGIGKGMASLEFFFWWLKMGYLAMTFLKLEFENWFRLFWITFICDLRGRENGRFASTHACKASLY